MELLNGVREIVAEIMDIDGRVITEETSLIGDLGAESIDLLELAVALGRRFGLPVQDDEIFLRKFPLYRLEAAQSGADPVPYLAERFPFLPPARIGEILAEEDRASVLTIGDLVRYLRHQQADTR